MTRPAGRPRDDQLHDYVQRILALKIGTSFFLPDASRDQLEFLRKPCKDAGAQIEICQVTHDEIYGTAGVRVFRREGQYDQL